MPEKVRTYSVWVPGRTESLVIEASRTDTTSEGELVFYLREGNADRAVARVSPGSWKYVREGKDD